jgi:Flp pilus assembly protein TadB
MKNKMKKRERKMEIFEIKVHEKKQKSKNSETDLQKRDEQMQCSLEQPAKTRRKNERSRRSFLFLCRIFVVNHI